MAPPQELHPTATGDAKSLVDAHQSLQDLVLYSGWFCPFVQRTWIVLEEKSIPYKYIEVNPYDKPASLLSANPRGLVPTLALPSLDPNGPPRSLYESNIICEYLEETYPQHGKSLLPSDTYEKARCRIWMDYVSTRIIPAFHRFLQFQPSSTATSIEPFRKEFLDTLRTFTGAMATKEPFFLGAEISMPDIVLAPWAMRLWVFSHFKDGGLGLPAEGEEGDDKVWDRWRGWVGAIGARKSVRETMSELEKYLPIYKPYADNTAQSELAKAIRQGRGVP